MDLNVPSEEPDTIVPECSYIFPCFLDSKLVSFGMNAVGHKKLLGDEKMDIFTMIKLDKNEVENLMNIEILESTEKISDDYEEVCIEGFLDKDSNSQISVEDAMEQLFETLKTKGIINESVETYSYELPVCGLLKNAKRNEEALNKDYIVLSYHA